MLRYILMITDRDSFAARSIASALYAEGLTIRPTGMSYSSLPKPEDCPPAIFMCVQDWEVDRKGVYGAVKDLVQTTGALFFIAGDKATMTDAAGRAFPHDVVTEMFFRPFNANQIAERVKALYEQHILSPEQSARLKPKTSAPTKRILIVDDNPTSLRALRGVLHAEYKVVMSDSGMSALTYLEENTPDLILLDYEMPVINGPQFLTMVRARDRLKKIPVIFLTGKSDRETVMTVMEKKPEGYILKSTPPDQILRKLASFFREREVAG